MDCQSCDEKKQDAAKAEANGTYFAAIMPSVLEKKSGTITYEVKATSCDLRLTFPWGGGACHLE